MSEPAVPAGPSRWQASLPIGLLGVLLLLFLAFVATQADAHGRSWDEGAQDWYGEAVYQWYVTRGADLTFMQAAPQLQMPQHGPVVEFAIATAQHAFEGTDRWLVRSTVGGVIGLLGIVGIALCGLELAGWWGAFLAAAGLACYPRYTGAVFNNSKDIPFAVAMIFLLWLTLRLARRWGDDGTYVLDSALVGLALGIALSIRVSAVLWLGVLGATAAVWWLRHHGGGWRRELGRQVVAGLLIGGCAYLAMIAMWPYVALHPVDGFVDSIRSMSRYSWTGEILFEGERVRGDGLPRRYAPVWLVIGSPLPVVVLGLVGAGFIVADLLRRRLTDARVLLAAGLLVVPLTVIVVTRPTLLNGPRHFLFVVPGLILLGTLGLIRLWSLALGAGRWRAAAAHRRALAAGLAAVAVLSGAQVVVAAARLYPFEYMYFSPVVGGYLGARDRYETDYWGVCQNPALKWLVAHHRDYPTPTPPTVGGLFDEAVRIPPGFAASPTPDFFVSSPYYPMPAGYLPIHVVTVEGAPLCTVNINPAYAR
jgi:hypothetical protein